MVIIVHVISKDVPLFRRFTVNLIYLYNYWEFFESRRDLAFVLKELRENIDCKIDCPAFNSCRIAGNCLFGVCDLSMRRLVLHGHSWYYRNYACLAGGTCERTLIFGTITVLVIEGRLFHDTAH